MRIIQIEHNTRSAQRAKITLEGYFTQSQIAEIALACSQSAKVALVFETTKTTVTTTKHEISGVK